MKNINFRLTTYSIAFIISLCGLVACNKLVNIKPSADTLSPTVVYSDSSSVQAAVVGMYNKLYVTTSSDQPYASGITYLNALYADDITNASYPQYQNDAIPVADPSADAIWSDSYASIYRSNSIIEGVKASGTLSQNVKNSATGEAEFMRALCYFYLVNLYEKVPLINSTNLAVNITASQASSAAIYAQIVSDLKNAANLLPVGYTLSGDRTRVNKYAAIALLARVYLYMGDYINAEAQATLVINNTATYSILSDETKVFLTNSQEAIFQFDSRVLGYPYIAAAFVPLTGVQPRFIISSQLLGAFEPGDTRKTNWIGTSAGFPFPYKYKSLAGVGSKEYDVVLRLAEQYLIRAEARAQQNNIAGAQADLNVIRNRASLANTTASTQATLLLAIEQERRVELFCEWGQRFLDLKRTNRADVVLGAEKPGVWKSTDKDYPIPGSEISNNVNLVQNPGY
jgi:hypothetical protein